MKRWHALDNLRALAVISMIQGHTTTALLRSDALPRDWERLHSLLHGLTAPAFLFGAGLAFGVTSYSRYERYQSPGSALHKRLRRYLLLFAIGYALQLPGGSLWAALHAHGDKLSLVVRVGPLQLIALVLGLAQLAMLVVTSARVHALGCAALALAITLFATPVARSGVSARIGSWAGAYLDDSLGSQFPIFPWAGFTLLGVAGAYLVRERPVWFQRRRLLGVGSTLALGAYLCFYYRWLPYDHAFFWRTGGVYLVFRLGCVIALLGVLSRPPSASAPVVQAAQGTSVGAVLARHSLIAYVAHLLLLYGTPLTPNLAHAWRGALSMPQAACASLLMIGATVSAVYVWDFLEHEPLWLARVRRVAFAAVGLVLLRP